MEKGKYVNIQMRIILSSRSKYSIYEKLLYLFAEMCALFCINTCPHVVCFYIEIHCGILKILPVSESTLLFY